MRDGGFEPEIRLVDQWQVDRDQLPTLRALLEEIDERT